jgi:hypothetical protein
MAGIPQPLLFAWEEIEELGDLSRLTLLLDNLPDEELMQKLEAARGNGRDDYPVRAMWNSLLAGVVLQHASIESLSRNDSARFERNGADCVRPCARKRSAGARRIEIRRSCRAFSRARHGVICAVAAERWFRQSTSFPAHQMVSCFWTSNHHESALLIGPGINSPPVLLNRSG